jgi:hypothetical protein
MKTLLYSICILFLTFFQNKSVNAQAMLDLETGPVFTGYNEIRSPVDLGTFFSLKDDLKSETKIFYRLRASYIMKSRHTISLLYAPLEIKSEGSVANDIFFKGVLFDANTQINGTYKFNSYRLTYRYNLVNKPKIVFGLGLTAKVRDAEINLSSTGLSAGEASIGFAPIINFSLWWKMDDKLGLLLDGDALVTPKGRAEDVHMAATYKFSDNMGIRAGYRILEGGVDNSKGYGFVLFHYASVGISYTFKNKIKAN